MSGRPLFPNAFSLLDQSVRVLGKEDFENPYLDLTDMSDVDGSDVLDSLINKGLVKANPKRGSSADKKEAFQDFLNRGGSQLVAQVPSQMPGAMGGGMGVGNAAAEFDHGIAGNMSDIRNRPIDYGVKGGPQQMPYRYGDQTGGIQQMPYTGGVPSLIDFGKGLEALKKGKERGGVMNDSTYEALQMLQGY